MEHQVRADSRGI